MLTAVLVYSDLMQVFHKFFVFGSSSFHSFCCSSSSFFFLSALFLHSVFYFHLEQTDESQNVVTLFQSLQFQFHAEIQQTIWSFW